MSTDPATVFAHLPADDQAHILDDLTSILQEVMYAQLRPGDSGASAAQVIIAQLLPLQNLAPGQYTLKIRVTDNIKKQTLTPSVGFTVN